MINVGSTNPPATPLYPTLGWPGSTTLPGGQDPEQVIEWWSPEDMTAPQSDPCDFHRGFQVTHFMVEFLWF